MTPRRLFFRFVGRGPCRTILTLQASISPSESLQYNPELDVSTSIPTAGLLPTFLNRRRA